MAETDDKAAALKSLAARRADYRRYRDYYRGKHVLAFATEKFRNAFANTLRAFADNLCPAVVDAVADRLQLTGFDVEEGDRQAGEAAWAIWTANRMDRRAGEAHLEALRAGDAYVVIWPDAEGRPTLWPNRADAMTVVYDDERPGRIVRAAKCWLMQDGRARLTLYYPDRLEKYATLQKAQGGIPAHANAFVPYEVEGEPWPLPNPWGVVPVVHLANNASIGELGRSELADVVPLQDALNKAHADRLVGQEFMALPQRWATGLEVETDPETGKERPPFVPGADRLWTVGDTEVTFGQFEAADLDKLTNTINDLRTEIARVSRTPIHYLLPGTGEFPSGESLKTAEAPFTAKVRDRQTAFGNAWEDALALALRMAGRPEARLAALWKEAAPRSEREAAEVALLKTQVGVSKQQALRELGYSDEQIAKIDEEKAANAEQFGTQLLSSFDRGQ